MNYFLIGISRYPIQPLTYSFDGEIQTGSRVIVQIRNKKHLGYVVGKTIKPEFDVKNISVIVDERTFIDEKFFKILQEFSKRYMTPMGELMDLCFPPAKIKGEKSTTIQKLYIVLNIQLSEVVELNLNKKEMYLIERLLEENILDYTLAVKKFSKVVVDALIEKGIISLVNSESNTVEWTIKLTHLQEQIANDILSDPSKPHLIHGITGSGKTEIYFEVADQIIKKGKHVLLLVPEISLTPQLLIRTRKRFPDKKIAIYHSSLGSSRKHEWEAAVRGEVDILIGTRSAIWIPMKDIGLIVVDEEQDESYKQYAMRPYYNAVDVARRRAELDGAYFVLSSATPRVETYHEAKEGKIIFHSIKDRAVGEIPAISIVDMRRSMGQILSQTLIEKIEKTAKNGNQTFLFVPKKGFASRVQCGDCGYIFVCPNCDVPMVYHKGEGILKCHYCGHIEPLPSTCPACGSSNLKKGGVGTERVESEVSKLFPGLRIKRMDREEIRSISSIEETLNKIARLDVDIVVGTKMITKGLDFPKVALVGIIDADHSLGMPDFRADERTFQLLSQVGGRAGRGVSGEVVIQTMEPDNSVIKSVISGNIDEFYNFEIERRKALQYPPFKELILITVEANDPNSAKLYAEKVRDTISGGPFELLGPVESPIFKLLSKYRMQILLKCDILDRAIDFLEMNLTQSKLDFNPIDFLKIDVQPYSF